MEVSTATNSSKPSMLPMPLKKGASKKEVYLHTRPKLATLDHNTRAAGKKDALPSKPLAKKPMLSTMEARKEPARIKAPRLLNKKETSSSCPLEKKLCNSDAAKPLDISKQLTDVRLPTPLHLLLPDHVVDLSTLPSLHLTSEEREDPQMCEQYAHDIYQHLLSSEASKVYSITPELLSNQTEVVEAHRQVLLDWIVQVHCKFNLNPETLHICVDIIDRYLQAVNVPKTELQLVGVAALFVAAKYEEIYPPSIEELEYIAANTYSTQQILKTEIDILRALDYQFGRPYPLTFLRRYSKVMGTTKAVHTLAKYFIEASYLSTDCRSLLPSQCAVGALSLAAKVVRGETMGAIWNPHMENYSWYSRNRAAIFAEQVLKNVLSYHSLYNSSKLQAVREKYTGNSREGLSAHPGLSDTLKDFAKTLK